MRPLLLAALLTTAATAVAAQTVIQAPFDPAPPPVSLPNLSLAQSPAAPPGGDEQYQPSVGQPGKDVIWVPTPDGLVTAMLTVAAVTKDDYVVDLGSGDGKIAIAAGKQFGARAHGIEYNPDLVALARRAAARAGVANRVTFAQGDIFKSDFTRATVVTLYLLPNLNLKLKPILLAMKPGTRIVSHAFNMGEWQPDRTIRTDDATGYYWVVPAKAEGRWAFEIGGDRFTARLSQQYQMLTSDGAFRDGKMTGTAITLTRTDGRILEGQLTGDTITGGGWQAKRVN
ncbi:methyltransferase domain-containing protein [Sandaracinobacteroides saxicola]|uniref:Class I SAM-dependent methyltransferase n=1 Tax=Sandaracinobacteroides saxicola TaxID=2759707 RepID=A0A7G5IG07_9SPHN|nr:class I SAM-dependent methyltransferase [Sandaracinobacteroides saxicola]QMW22299.1 class I SAM-dependent methyltransferase [Sandaracinobacteroides saxicola]